LLEFPAVPGLSFAGAPLPKTVFRFGGLPFGLQALFPFTVTTLSFGGLKNLFDGSYQPFASHLSNFSRKRIRIAERPASGSRSRSSMQQAVGRRVALPRYH
jgi:hypothetical protein